MKSAIAYLALCVTACSTTAEMATKPPFAVVHSQKVRDAVAECLLNRLTTDDLLPAKTADGPVTTVSFASRGMVRQPAVYVFVIHDEGAGSAVEVHRFAHASLVAAETCF